MGQFSKVDRSVLIRQGKPIEESGLTFYPIQMCHYETFLICKNALAVRLSTLPVKYAIKDYINAVFTFEVDSLKEKRGTAGIFSRILELLRLSLRIDDLGGKNFFEKNVLFRQVNGCLEIDRLKLTQNNKTVEVPIRDISTKVRVLIAEQNGIELPDENINAELEKAQEELSKIKSGQVKLNQNIGSLISSVAYNSKVSEREIDDWTILEFENRRKAIDRDKKYMLYGQAEMSGMVTFKKGNPYPSWCYDSIDDSMGTMALSALAEQNGNAEMK